ncbi:MAG: DNA-binding protein, partial [Candidatus Acidiferrum sp.]
MGEPFPGTAPSLKPNADRLDSWKEIAGYLNRDVTTVQRWEKREGMPVHRHLHDRMGSVYASRAELDEWTRSRRLLAERENGNEVASPDSFATETRGEISKFYGGWRLALVATAGIIAVAVGTSVWVQKQEYFWRSPIAGARFQKVTDFEGVEQAATVSRDGHFVAFLSDRDGQTDVWLTQVGSGQFHNLTHGSVSELINPSVRTLGFSPDGSLVMFWVRKREGTSGGDIGIWAVPTLGGEPRP